MCKGYAKCSSNLTSMTQNNPLQSILYADLHATVVDALRHDLPSPAVDHAAHEVLQRLRDLGLAIPANPSV